MPLLWKEERLPRAADGYEARGRTDHAALPQANGEE
jgi:hypothetical protein